MMIERFDLDVGVDQLDSDSIPPLIELSDLWRARARLRSRWLMRNALDALPDFHFDQFIACDYAKLECDALAYALLDQLAEHYAAVPRVAPPSVAPNVRISKEQ